MMYAMKEEGEIKKVENFFLSGGLCSLPGMCCQSESDSSRLISPHRGTVNPPLLI